MSSKEQKTPDGQAPDEVIMEQQEAAEVETAETTEQVDPRDEQIANLQAQLAEVQQRERDAVLRSKAEYASPHRTGCGKSA